MNRFVQTLLVGALVLCPRNVASQDAALGLAALDSLLTQRVSTAARYDQNQTEAPASVTIVTREEIRRFGYQTVEEVLHNQVGFYSANDREYADIGVRGVGRPGYYNNKILVLVDGHPMNDDFTGGARVSSALAVDLETVERIEIVRGPGSSLYGARAMLGVVNMVTRKGRDIDGLELVAEGGSRGLASGVLSYGTVFGPESDLSVSVSHGRSEGEDIYFPELDNPLLNQGVAEDLDWSRQTRALATFRRSGLQLQAGMGRRSKGIPTGPWGSAFNHPEARTEDRTFFGDVSYLRAVADNAELAVRGGYDRVSNHGYWPFSSVVSGGAIDVEHEVEMSSVGGEATLEWEPAPSQRVVFGVQGKEMFDAHLHSPETTSDHSDHTFTQLSAFVHQEFQVTDRLALTLGIRRDEYSSVGGATTPRAALVYHAGEGEQTTLKLLFGEAFRVPNHFELHTTSLTNALLSNPDLDPERVRTLEAVWEQSFGRLATTVSLFQNDVRDLIELVEVPMPDSLRQWGRFAFQQQNVSSVRARGVELEARLVLSEAARLRFGYSFTDAVDAHDASDEVVNAPAHLFRVGGFTGVRDWFTVGGTIRAEGSRRSLYGTETDPMAVVDVTLTRELSEELSLTLAADNLFDEYYATPGGFQHVQSVIPQPGRTLRLRADYRW